MAYCSHFFLLATIVVFALLSIASAEYRSGRSLKPYRSDDRPSYKAGRSLETYEPEENAPSYKSGHSLHSYKPLEKSDDAINIQGMIYCRESKDLIPMQGATARVTCMLKDKYGDEKAPFSVKTPVTDKKGYFLINLANYTPPGYTLGSCRVFLNEPADYCDCNVPTDTNDGLSGAHPSKPRRLSDNAIIYSVAPFVFKLSSK
ncbi:proline-rich protein 1-like [Chenopodium quinoa]|nr:proline-rich protein 1-like [Chenopodium quinoa]